MSKEREKAALRVTKDYSIFVQSKENRPVELSKRRSLKESMQKYGFLAAYPLHCMRQGGKLEVRDGQHRLAVATELGLNVWYVVLTEEVNVAEVNNTQKAWTLANYAQSFAAQGIQDYAELLQFIQTYRMPIGSSFGLLAGGSQSQNFRHDFLTGKFKVKARERAALVASLFRHLVGINRQVNNARLIQAIYACTYVPDFDVNRVRDAASSSAEKLIAYSTSEGYLDMLEELHNFRRQRRVAIKVPAQNAMRARNPALRLKSDT